MAINNFYPSTSLYSMTPINKTGKYLDFLNYRVIPKYQSDIYFEIPRVYQFRPDMLAYDLYMDPRLYWVFAARNPNVLGPDPYFDFVAGLSIYVPKLDTLKAALGI